jgi:serine/threonine protein kinase
MNILTSAASAMSYCISPTCPAPDKNSPTTDFCMSCGAKILLKDRYRALKLLGQGGFGKTFKAVDEDQPRKPLCVIKQFAFSNNHPETRQIALKLFYEEAQHLEALGKHEQIPELLAYFDVEGQPYLVQQFIDGQDLEQELATAGTFNQAKIRELLESLLPVLDFLHHQSPPVIHRDIKPANIIRRRSDGGLVLVDFGAAKQATQSMLAKTGTAIGSAEFAAPEQARRKPAFASDIYSLGVTCIYLLTQVSPFDLFDMNQDVWVWRDYLVDNPVDEKLGEVLDMMIANSLSQRYQSAAEVLAALCQQSIRINNPLSGNPISSIPQPVQPKPTAQPVTPQPSPFNNLPSTTTINRPVKTVAPQLPVIDNSQTNKPIKSPVQSLIPQTSSAIKFLKFTGFAAVIISGGYISLLFSQMFSAPKTLKPISIISKTNKINDATQIGFLERKLQRDLNQNWPERNQIRQSAKFIVNVNQDGEISNYQALDGTNLSQSSLTPLPKLLAGTLDPNEGIGSFKVVFTSTGIIETVPVDILHGNKSLGKPITDLQLKTTLLEGLKKKLQNTLNVKPIDIKDLNYRVAVTANGEIADYEPTDQGAYKYETKNPLARLTKFNAQATISQEPLAQYNVLFRSAGEIVVTSN